MAEPTEPVVEPTEPVVEPTVEPVEDVTNLKKALKAEREGRKAAERREAAAVKATEKSEQEALERNKEFETLYTQSKDKLTALETQVAERDVDNALTAIAAGITKDGNKRNDITALYRKYAKHTESGVIFEHGGMPLTTEELTEKIKVDRPYLVDGSLANGANAIGNESAGGASTNTKTQEQVNAMSEDARMKFFTGGGTIIDPNL